MSEQVRFQNNGANARQARVLEGIARFIGADLLRRDMVENRLPFSARKSRAVAMVLAAPEQGARKLTRFTYRG